LLLDTPSVAPTRFTSHVAKNVPKRVKSANSRRTTLKNYALPRSSSLLLISTFEMYVPREWVGGIVDVHSPASARELHRSRGRGAGRSDARGGE
jgi:hypothetical protein